MLKRAVLCLLILGTISLVTAQNIAAAIQLVRPDESHFQLELVPESLQALQNINREVAVLGVVGPYHSGKSYLLNQLLQRQNAFDIGSSVDPKTRGIWMWTEPILYEGKTIILLDTEGFFGSNVSEVYDAKIFSVTALLSSYMIYNTVRTVDQATIDYIELLARRTQLFKLKSSEEDLKGKEAKIKFDFPFFHWVIQDFVHNMTAEQATTWLLNSMQAKHTDAESYEEGLLEIFEAHNLECTTLVYPQTDSEKLKDLSRITDEELLVEYRQQMAQLRDRILNRITVKKEGLKALSGPAFVVLLQTLVEAANSDKFPSMPSVWHSFIESSRKEAREYGVLKYKENLGELLQEFGLPNAQEFETLHQTAVKNAQNLMAKQLYGLVDSIDQDWQDVQVKIRLEYEYNKLINQNEIEKYLNEQKTQVFQRTKAQIQQTNLPKSSSEIKNNEHATISRATDEFKQSTHKYGSSARYQTLIDELQHELRGQYAQLLMENSNLIQLHLKDNVDAVENNFRAELAASGGTIIVPQLLESELATKKSRALGEYRKRTVVYKDETVYQLFLNNVETQLENAMKGAKDKNNELIEKFITDLHSRLESRALKQMSEVDVVDIDDLTRELEHIRDAAIVEYKNAVKDYAATNSYKFHLYELNDILNGKKDQMTKHLIAELQDKYESHLRKAKDEIESAFVCGDWPTTRTRAIKILQKHLSQLGVSKTSELKLAERFADKDIKDLFDNNCPASRSWMWIAIGLVTIISAIFALRKK